MSNTPREDAPGNSAADIDTLGNEAFLTRWSKRKAL